MSNERTLPHGVMEGKGAYNKYAKVPAGGGALALPLLEGAASDLALDTKEVSVVVADPPILIVHLEVARMARRVPPEVHDRKALAWNGQ